MKDFQNDCFNIVEFYNNQLKPYRYIYNCMFGIKIDFTIDPDQICHLIFGTIDKNIPNSNSFKGIKGYDNMLNKTMKNCHSKIMKNFNKKSKAFIYLPKVLENPSAIFFNHEIISKGNIPGLKKTDIHADFLLFKQIENKKIHLFLKWSAHKKKLVPLSLINNIKDTYTYNQKYIKILNKEKRLR